MKSEFLEWFVAQHKPRTDSGMPHHTDQQLRDLVHSGQAAARVLACREMWDEKRQSALYAWTARPDGDALRLAVAHGYVININKEAGTVTAGTWQAGGESATEPLGADPNAATRRAIFRAAAAMCQRDDRSNDE